MTSIRVDGCTTDNNSGWTFVGKKPRKSQGTTVSKTVRQSKLLDQRSGATTSTLKPLARKIESATSPAQKPVPPAAVTGSIVSNPNTASYANKVAIKVITEATTSLKPPKKPESTPTKQVVQNAATSGAAPAVSNPPATTLGSMDFEDADIDAIFDTVVKKDKEKPESLAKIAKESGKKEASQKEMTQHKTGLPNRSDVDNAKKNQATIVKVQQAILAVVKVPRPIDQTPGLTKINKHQIRMIRFSQDSVSGTTGDKKLTLAQLAQNIYQFGFLPSYAIHVVNMRGKMKSADNKYTDISCQTSFDNRRLLAANMAFDIRPIKDIIIYAVEHDGNDKIRDDKIMGLYKQMVQDFNNSIAELSNRGKVRWRDPYGIQPETWGHIIVLRTKLGHTCPEGEERYGYLRKPKVIEN